MEKIKEVFFNGAGKIQLFYNKQSCKFIVICTTYEKINLNTSNTISSRSIFSNYDAASVCFRRFAKALL